MGSSRGYRDHRAAWWAMALVACACTPVPAEPRPNLLLITLDTLRADALGCYGGRREVTPELDRLATEGVRFARAYAHAPLTLPAHGSILTGRYPFEHGLRDNGGFRFEGAMPTLASVLRGAGYRTAAFVSAFPLDRRFGLDHGFEVYDDRFGERSSWRQSSIVERRAAQTWAAAQAWLGRSAAGPWFLWIHLFDPHYPYEPPAGEPERVAGSVYLAEVRYVDKIVGRIVAAARSGGPLLVCVLADHGESLGEHGESTHGVFAYDTTLRIPWMLAGLDLPRGRVVEGLARQIDVLPTVLELLGLEPVAGVSGRSLAACARGGGPTGVRASYFESLSSYLGRGWAPLYGTINWPHKLVELPIPELYDLERDPRELDNLLPGPAEPAARLRRSLPRVEALLPAGETTGRVSAEERAKLQALGYAGGGAARPQSFGPESDPKRLIRFELELERAVQRALDGQPEQAIAQIEELLARRPELREGYLQLAVLRARGGDPQAASEALQRAIQRGFDDPELRAQLGLYLHESGRAAEAIEVLQQVVLEAPFEVDARNYLAIALASTERLAEARAQLGAVLELDPGNGEALTNLGSLRLAEGDAREALKFFDQALEQDPRLAIAHNGKGVAHAQLGELKQAELAWTRAVELDPQLWDALYNLGSLLRRSANPAASIPFLERFLRGAPKSRYAKDLELVSSWLGARLVE